MQKLLRIIFHESHGRDLFAPVYKISDDIYSFDTSTRQCIGDEIVAASAVALVATGRDNDILPPTDGICHGRGLAACRKLHFPQELAGAGVERAKAVIEARADEHQATCGSDGTADGRHAEV